jgi:hypothetical protein
MIHVEAERHKASKKKTKYLKMTTYLKSRASHFSTTNTGQIVPQKQRMDCLNNVEK